MRLDEAVSAIETLAPVRLAASWDNVGLLLEGDRPVRRALATIDLSAAVAAEALSLDVDLVIAYHPPIFSGIKRLTMADPRGRSLLSLVRAGIHLYSPHTALDAAVGGVNDWLLEPFSPGEVTPIEPNVLTPEVGAGRRATLERRWQLDELVAALKTHLGLTHLRVAGGRRGPVRTMAVCPGAGGSIFAALDDVDLYLTGEMRHHDVLAKVEAGAAVILTDHTNTERGYLPRLAERLALAGLPTLVSTVDADPLHIQ